MFDPYGIYTRSEKKTRQGQVIRKKPVDLRGSVSRDDYGVIRDYAEALGYQLLPKALVPFPEETLSFTDSVYNFELVVFNGFTFDFKLWTLTKYIQDLPNMLIVPSLAYTLNSLKIEFFFEYASISMERVFGTPPFNINLYTYNNYSGLGEQIWDTDSRVIVYSGDENNQYYFYNKDANSEWENKASAFSMEPLIPGPVDYVIYEWTDNDALDVYQMIQTADPDHNPAPAGFPDIRYFRFFRGSSNINLVIRFSVNVTTNWTHTINAEFIGQ